MGNTSTKTVTVTHTVICNNTSTPVIVKVSEVNSHDWNGGDRPDHNLDNLTISPGSSIRKREKLNSNAKSHSYKVSLERTDDSVGECRIDQGIACYDERRDVLSCWSGSDKYATMIKVDTNTNTVTITDIQLFADPSPSTTFGWIGGTQASWSRTLHKLEINELPPPWTIVKIQPQLRVFRGSSSIVIKHDVSPTDMYEKLSSLGETDRIIFIAHGFLNTGDKPYINDMIDAILRYENATVIIVDWGGGGANIIEYMHAVSNMQVVGAWVGSYAKFIRFQRGRNVYIWGIGHSLGSHLMGAAGRKSKTFDRITGLDPAVLLFDDYNKRLSKGDAKIVDVINTDGYCGYPHFGPDPYGILVPVGTTDFYPDWGMRQHGNHPAHHNKSYARVYELFIGSISNRAFTTGQILASAPSCQNIIEKRKECSDLAEIISFMGFHLDKDIAKQGGCYYNLVSLGY